MAFPRETLFSPGVHATPEATTAVTVDWTNTSTLVASAFFHISTGSGTVVSDFIGGRPCVSLNGNASGATNNCNLQVAGDCIRPMAGKTLVFKGGIRMTTVTQDFALGFASTTTNFIASSATDYIAIQKLTGVTQFSLISRKASGTAATTTLSPVVTGGVWYDFSISIKMDPTTAGLGTVQVAFGSSVTPGTSPPIVYNAQVTNVPDTVTLRPIISWRAGSAASVFGYVSRCGWELEA